MEKMYFIDFESYCYEDGKIHGDLGWESEIENTMVEDVRLAKTFIKIWWDEDGHYYDGCIPILRVFEGIYFDGYWDVPRACDREYIYTIACCSKDEGKRLGIDANEYIG